MSVEPARVVIELEPGENLLRAADRSGARLALVAGHRDIEAGTVGLKDLTTGEQVDVATDSVVAEVLSRLDH